VTEPVVVAADIQRVLRQVVRPDDPDAGDAVQRIAERADTSPRSVYRVLNPAPPRNGGPATLSLDLADRLAIAVGRQLSEIGCRVVIDGELIDYVDA
jgi:hypothetical protein